jgi:hypothetical protein
MLVILQERGEKGKNDFAPHVSVRGGDSGASVDVVEQVNIATGVAREQRRLQDDARPRRLLARGHEECFAERFLGVEVGAQLDGGLLQLLHIHFGNDFLRRGVEHATRRDLGACKACRRDEKEGKKDALQDGLLGWVTEQMSTSITL